VGTYLGYFPYEPFATWTYYEPMTAIVVVHTADGFVIGADGRRFDSKTGTLLGDAAPRGQGRENRGGDVWSRPFF